MKDYNNERIPLLSPVEKQVRKAVSELRPFEKNSRTHSADQIDQICASVAEWGWTMPILIDDTGLVLAGHARLLAAQKLGFAEVPCIVAAGWSEAQKRAYVIADNRLAENAGWDKPLLAAEFGDLKATGFDLTLTGFTLVEIGAMESPEHVPVQASAEDVAESFGIYLECASETEQESLYSELTKRGVSCKLMS